MDERNADDIEFLKSLADAVNDGDVEKVDRMLGMRRKASFSSPDLDKLVYERWIFNSDVSSFPRFEKKKLPQGSTILHIAAMNGDQAMVKMLVENWDVNPSGQSKDKGTVNNANQTLSYSPLELINEKQENLNQVYEYLKNLSSVHAITKPKGALLKSNTGSFTSGVSASFLQAAAEGNVESMKEIIKSDSLDVNCTDYDKRTACHLAASEGRLNVLKFLIEEYPKICAPDSKLCNVLAYDRWGHTPYNDAIRENNTECADYLRENGGGEENDAHTFKDTSPETYKALQARGIAEKWAISKADFKMEKAPFARGAGGELFKIKWRGLTCVAKSCAGISANDNQISIDLANEISMMATLRHPHLVMFLGACFQVTPPLLLMEFCEGGTLEEKILRSLRGDSYNLSMPTRLRYMQELAIGMCFLHCCNPPIVHRDLKPSNVLLTGDDHIKITDFGLSKFIPAKNKTFGDKFAMTGETGSYRFMAPEVFKHEEYNAKVDIYSYALVCYWVVTGFRPFSNIADPVQAVKKAATENHRPTLASIKNMPHTSKLFERAWAQDSTQRPDFTELTELLTTKEIKNEFHRRSWFWF